MSIILDFKDEMAHQICSLMWADNFWLTSHSKKNLEKGRVLTKKKKKEEGKKYVNVIADDGIFRCPFEEKSRFWDVS